MSDPQPGPPQDSTAPVQFDLGDGLLQYYSSQAKLMLAQYENINRLLGPTSDWTHPGDFCEVLFRDFLRKFLPPSLSADKGFFHGRATLEGKNTHCPEIDILIHDTQRYRPIFRMGDFVIVQPQAVRGIIQVKRSHSQVQVARGLKNVVRAKQHLLNVLWKDKPKGWSSGGMPPSVFTAVIGFENEIGQRTGFYRKHLLGWSVKHRTYDRETMQQTNMYVLPGFIGSLRGIFLMKHGPYWNPCYYVYRAHCNRENTCIQALLLAIYNELSQLDSDGRPPFAFPPNMKPYTSFLVLRFTKAELSSDGTISIYRNDKRKGQYRKADGDIAGPIHLICDSDGALKTSEGLEQQLTPGFLLVRRASGVERYEKVSWELLP